MPEDIRTIAVLAGIALQLLALIVVIYQLSRLNLSIRISAQAAVYQQATDARAFLVQYPELRKYFFDGVVADPGSEDYSRAKTVGEMFLNYMEHLILQRGSLRSSDWTAWQNFARKTLCNSPILREVLAEQPDAYCEELVKLSKHSANATTTRESTTRESTAGSGSER